MPFHTIKWLGDRIEILDQRLLPAKVSYITLHSPSDVERAIKELAIRGAPAIGVCAAMGAVLGALAIKAGGRDDFLLKFREVTEIIASSRPTAKNLFWALDRMKSVAENSGDDPNGITRALELEAKKIYREDIETNIRIGKAGDKLLKSGDTVLTHCNAGALATAGYGTALGVIRAAIEAKKDIRVIATETRPLLQGSRLTTWELIADNIDVTLITDGMAGHFLKAKKIQKVIVGADRIAANGDVANKIGTYSHAVLARENKVPFYVAAPTSTIDVSIPGGEDIPIEERDPMEVRTVMGKTISPPDVKVLNPAFDVTPNRYVSAIITERGIIRPPYRRGIERALKEG
jgi:methylthioribose-1-phosphate isomerase